MSAETSAVLNRAADLCEQGWTQGAFARNAAGESASPSEGDACCWCASGAIGASIREIKRGASSPWDALAVVADAGNVIDWNDAPERTQAEVVAALREAARRERAGQ